MRGLRIGLLAVAMGACAANKRSEIPPQVEATGAGEPRRQALGPGDIVSIRVFREPELTGKYRIPETGPNDFPLIGEISMVGKTPQEVQVELTERLADGFLVAPQVTVFVEERNSQRIYVLGQVQKPGTFGYTANMTVIEAITMAGGFAPLASQNGVKISRTVDGEEVVLKVAVGSISSGSASNVRLQPGDIVYVPEALF